MPSPSPSDAGSDAIPVNGLGVVTTNDLRVRSKPEVSDASELLTPLLDFGRQVFVVAGPVADSGYEWYQVQPINGPGESEELPFGWVAAADKDGTPWLVTDAPECDPAPKTAADFAAIRPILGLACYGNEELTFRGPAHPARGHLRRRHRLDDRPGLAGRHVPAAEIPARAGR